MNAALITYAVALLQLVGENVANGKQTTADDLAALDKSDAALAMARARWQSTLPKKEPRP